MLVPDPARALGEIAARPPARAAASRSRSGGPASANPWLGVVFDAVSAELGAPMPPPGIPGPFSLEDADKLEACSRRPASPTSRSGSCRRPTAPRPSRNGGRGRPRSPGPLAQRLAALPEHVARALFVRARTAIGAYETPAGLEIPGLSLIAAATRVEPSNGRG